MNLQLHLLLRIVVMASLCLALMAGYTLYDAHHQIELNKQQSIDVLHKQLLAQLRLAQAGIGRNTAFPDFETWKLTNNQAGLCIEFKSADRKHSRNFCQGEGHVATDWPLLFAGTYRFFFQPGTVLTRSIELEGQSLGSLSLSSSVNLELAHAWKQVQALLSLSSITVLSVCALVYLSLRRALKPAGLIVNGLAKLKEGQLDYRLPEFQLKEWQCIAGAINQLAASQQTLLAQRQLLTGQLLTVQEQERRDVARELHDEFGQCLSASNAMLVLLKQSVSEGSLPDALPELERLEAINHHMLGELRALLCRLRPPEFDELGLMASLQGLVNNWKQSCRDKIQYHLQIVGDVDRLSEAQAIQVYRIIQEALNNIHKHAAAKAVTIELKSQNGQVQIIVQDNGILQSLPIKLGQGIGLLGIRERLGSLKGELSLKLAEPHGLILTARFPLKTEN